MNFADQLLMKTFFSHRLRPAAAIEILAGISRVRPAARGTVEGGMRGADMTVFNSVLDVAAFRRGDGLVVEGRYRLIAGLERAARFQTRIGLEFL